MKIFYALHHPHLLLDELRYTTLFRAHSVPLATRQVDHNHLVGCEMSNSPSCWLGLNGHSQVTFSAYGTTDDQVRIPAFKGERLDPFTGHYLLGNGYRAYNPSLMRFNGPDSESPFARGGLNAYAFALGDPINRNDPTGHAPGFITSILRAVFVNKTYRGRIVAEFHGIVAFTGPDRADGQLPTLYISAHGKPGLITADRIHIYDARGTFEALRSRGVDMRNRQTHLLACDSALPDRITGRSFIDDLSDLTGAQSSGYDASIAVVERRQGDEFIAEKQRVLPNHGFTSKKNRAGNIRKPNKDLSARTLGRANRIMIV